MTKEELDILYWLFYRSYNTIGYDLKTENGRISREGLFEVIMDSGWTEYHAEKDEQKKAISKFRDLDFGKQNEYIKHLLPDNTYECGIEGREVI